MFQNLYGTFLQQYYIEILFSIISPTIILYWFVIDQRSFLSDKRKEIVHERWKIKKNVENSGTCTNWTTYPSESSAFSSARSRSCSIMTSFLATCDQQPHLSCEKARTIKKIWTETKRKKIPVKYRKQKLYRKCMRTVSFQSASPCFPLLHRSAARFVTRILVKRSYRNIFLSKKKKNWIKKNFIKYIVHSGITVLKQSIL